MSTGTSGASRRLRTSAASLVLIVLLVLLWPSAWGGAATFVRVTGTSMEPGLVDGDLVIARSGGYEVGDVVVYPVTDGLVIHRIVGVNDDGTFVTQGDNRARIDPWTPPASAVLGAQWLHIPKAGDAVLWVAGPAGRVAVGTFVALWVTAAQVRRRRRRRRRARKEIGMRQRQPHTAAIPPAAPSARLQAALLVGAVVAVSGLAGTVLAYITPTQRIVETPVAAGSATLDFVYEASTTNAQIYPDGRVGPVGHAPAEDDPTGVTKPPQPLYRKLISAINATATFTAPVDGADVTGQHRFLTIVRSTDGWEETLSSTPWSAFEGGEFQIDATIDLAEAERVVSNLAALIENNAAAYDIAFRAEVALVATSGELTEQQTFEPELTFQVGNPLVQPTTAQQHQFPIELVEPVQQTTTTFVGPLPVRTGTARILSPLLAIAGLALAVPLAGSVFLGWGQRPAAAFRARHRSIVVDVEPDATLPGPLVPVVSPNELVRLSKRAETMVLHADLGGGRHRFAVPALDATYVYTFEDPGPVVRPVVDPTPEEVST